MSNAILVGVLAVVVCFGISTAYAADAPAGGEKAQAKGGEKDRGTAKEVQTMAVFTKEELAKRPKPPLSIDVPPGPYVTEPRPVKLGKIPKEAEIVYHAGSDAPGNASGHLCVMDRNGKHVSQITLETPHHWEHVTVSFNRRYVLGNHHDVQGQSQLWVFDLDKGTEVRMVPQFYKAGEGGIGWAPDGYAYFTGQLRKEDRQDLFRMKVDGTGLQRLTNTPEAYESDVGISEDGKFITYVREVQGYVCIWMASADGTNQRMVHEGGWGGVSSAHDPEFSPDNQWVAFSVVNGDYKNWPDNPVCNTAHDIWKCKIDGTEMTRLTKPGPISIIPNWQDDWICYTLLSEKGNFKGSGIVRADGTGEQKLKKGAESPKWIPPPARWKSASVGPVGAVGRV